MSNAITKQVAQINAEMHELRLKMEDLKDKLAAIQRRCPHPGDKRTVVTNLENIDYVSCEDCGKLLPN